MEDSDSLHDLTNHLFPSQTFYLQLLFCFSAFYSQSISHFCLKLKTLVCSFWHKPEFIPFALSYYLQLQPYALKHGHQDNHALSPWGCHKINLQVVLFGG